MRFMSVLIVMASAAVHAAPIDDGLLYLRQQQDVMGALGGATGESKLLATTEAVETWRALGLAGSPEAQAAMAALASEPAVPDVELEGRRAAALRGTAWAIDFFGVTFGAGFTSPEPAVQAWFAPSGTSGLGGARQLALQMPASGCGAYADEEPDAALIALVALQLRDFETDPIVRPRLLAMRNCLQTLVRSGGGFGTPSASALAALALIPAGSGAASAVAGARAHVLGAQQSNGGWGGVRATALAIRALAFTGADWRIRYDDGHPPQPTLVLLNPQPVVGEPVRARLEVINNSTASAPAVPLRFSARRGAEAEVVLLDTQVPALAAGVATLVEVDLPTTALSGKYVVKATVDPANAVPELNELDNVAFAPITVDRRLDLAVSQTSLTFVPAGGSLVNVQLAVKVLGSTLDVPLRVDFFKGSATTGTLISSQTVAAGTSVNGTAQVTASWDTASLNGPQVVTAVVDPLGAIAESNEQNNTATRYFFGAGGKVVDLAVQSADISVTPATVLLGKPFTVNAVIRNVSANDAVGVPVVLRTFDGVRLSTVEVASVPANGQAVAALRTQLATNTSLLVEVDPDQTLLETMRGNNWASLSVDLRPQVNLVATSLTTSAQPQAGDRFTASFSFNITGETSSTSRVRAIDLESGQVVFDQPTRVEFGPALVIPLLASSSAPRIRVCIDPDDAIAELNENDNCLTETFGAASTQLELSNRRMRVTPIGPMPGDVVKIEADVINTSTVAAGVTVEWFLGRPDRPEGLRLGETQVASVPASGFTVARTEFVMPDGAVPEIHARLVAPSVRNISSGNKHVGRHLFLESIIDLARPTDLRPTEGLFRVVGKLTPSAAPSLVIGYQGDFLGCGGSGTNCSVHSAGVEVLRRDGSNSYTQLWKQEWNGYAIRDLVLADLDRDGSAEIVVLLVDGNSMPSERTRYIEVQALTPTGTTKWSARVLAEAVMNSLHLGALGLADLNGDAVTDVVVADTRLLGFSGTNGALIRDHSLYPQFGSYAGNGQVIPVDVENDGTVEFLVSAVGNSSSSVTLVNFDGGVRWNRTTSAIYGKLGVLDLDLDGLPEVVHTQYQGPVSAYSAIDGNSQSQTGGSAFFYMNSLSAAPFRQDGLPSIAAGSGQLSHPDFPGFSGKIFGLRPDLSVLYNQNIETAWEHHASQPTYNSVAVDLLGHGRPQLLGVTSTHAILLNDSRDGRPVIRAATPDRVQDPSRNNLAPFSPSLPTVADLSTDGGAFAIVSYAAWQSQASVEQPHYGHAEALVFSSKHWKTQPSHWPHWQFAKGQIREDLSVDERNQWWRTHNTYNAQFVNEPAMLMADLMLETRADGGVPASGSTFALSATLKNVGGVAASNAQVAFYDGAPDAGGRLIGNATVPGPLAVRGGSAPATVNWQAFPDGPHTIHVVANPSGAIAESGRENNESSFQVWVGTGTALCDLELVPGTVEVTPSPGVAGQAITARATVRNAGSAGCLASDLRVFDGDPSSSNRVATAAVPVLAVGASSVVTAALTAVPGTTTYTFVLDEAAALLEANRANNVATVQHATPQGTVPDFVVVSASASPTTAVPGQTVQLTVRVRNVGMPAPASTVIARVGGVTRGSVELPGLAVGATTDVVIPVTAGSVTEVFQAVVDPSSLVSELSETNNSATVTVTVQPASVQLVATATPSSASAFANVAVQVAVTNSATRALPTVVSAEVRDASGVVLAQLLNQQAVLVGAGQTVNVPATWNTGFTPPGSYQVVAFGSADGRTLQSNTAVVTVVAESVASLGVIADQGIYAPGESALLRQRVTNSSRNQGLAASSLVLEVRSPSNAVVFSTTRAVQALPALATTDRSDLFVLSPTLAPGAYQVTSQWRIGSTVLANASTSFQVQYTASQAVSGTVAAASPFNRGPALPVTVQLANPGTLALGSTTFDVELLAMTGLNRESIASQSVTLAAGGSTTLNVSLPTTAVTPGNKLLTLRLGGRLLHRISVTASSTAADVDPPVIAVTGVTHGQLTNASVTPVISVTDASSVTVTATLDGAAFTSGTAVNAAGAHRLVVNAVDAAGNSASRTIDFTQDFTPPVLTLAGVTHGAILRGPVTLTFSATDANPGTTTSTLDGAAFTSGGSVSAAGAHTWVVRSTDAAGNLATETRSFTLDLTPPVITISGVTHNQFRNGPVTPTFSSTDANPGTTTATMDGAAFTSGSTVSAQGQHTLVVTARDAATNQSQTTIVFTIDTTAPVITVTGVTQGASGTSFTPVFSASDTNGVTVTATLNGAAFTSGTVVNTAGSYSLVVNAQDVAGNTASRTIGFTVTAPASIRPNFSFAVCATGSLDFKAGTVMAADGGVSAIAASTSIDFWHTSQVRGDMVAGFDCKAWDTTRVSGSGYYGNFGFVASTARVDGGMKLKTPAPTPCHCAYNLDGGVATAAGSNNNSNLTGVTGWNGTSLSVPNTTVTLPAGRYFMQTLDVGATGSVTAATGAQVEIYVANSVTMATGGKLGAAPGQPPLLVVVGGSTVQIRNSVDRALLLYAPRANLDLATGVTNYGAIVGKNVTVTNQSFRSTLPTAPTPFVCQ